MDDVLEPENKNDKSLYGTIFETILPLKAPIALPIIN